MALRLPILGAAACRFWGLAEAQATSNNLRGGEHVEERESAGLPQLRQEDTSLPKELADMGCKIVRGGQYVECDYYGYDSSGLQPDLLATYDGPLDDYGAMNMMKYEGIDIMWQRKVVSATKRNLTGEPDPPYPISEWEWYGVNFGTAKTPIWETTKSDFSYKRFKHDKSQSKKLYLRRGEKYANRLFQTYTTREKLKTQLWTKMQGCYSNYGIAMNVNVINQLLKGMALDAHAKLVQGIVTTIILFPLLFVPAAGVGAALLEKAMANCGTMCENIVKHAHEPAFWKDIFDTSINYATDEAITLYGYTGQLASEAIELGELVMKVLSKVNGNMMKNTYNLTVQDLYLYNALYDPEAGSGSNCTLAAAEKLFKVYNEQFESMKAMHGETHTQPISPIAQHIDFEAWGICYSPDWKGSKSSGWKYTHWKWDAGCIPLNSQSTTSYQIYGDGKDVHPDFVDVVQKLATYPYDACTLTGFKDLKCREKGAKPSKAP